MSQSVIDIPHSPVPHFAWTGEESDYHSEVWDTRVITNVSTPTMSIHLPKEGTSNGTSLIVAPGGGLYAHSIESEGTDVAKWMTSKGITVFVLKYRLVPYQGDATKAFGDPKEKAELKAKKMLPYSANDGIEAIKYIRMNAERLNLDPTKIGLMGFSAGGAVTMAVTRDAPQQYKPNFIIPVYPWMSIIEEYSTPDGAPPMLVICASDDPLEIAPMSIDLYSQWLDSNKSAALHMYSKGGHGFGMRVQGLATDSWIERCYEWMQDESFIPKRKEND